MPLPDLPLPLNPVPILLDGTPVKSLLGEPSPHFYSFEVPQNWWSWIWRTQYRFHVSGRTNTNLGVYGPNPPLISGRYGKLSSPAPGVYDQTYSDVRTLSPGRYYLAMRFDGESADYSIRIKKA